MLEVNWGLIEPALYQFGLAARGRARPDEALRNAEHRSGPALRNRTEAETVELVRRKTRRFKSVLD
jgi:hypothetical protein